MDNIILIFICLFAGVGLQYVRAIPANAHLSLNQFVIYISLPAMALFYIPKIAISTKLLYPLGVAWLGFILCWLFFGGLGKIFGWPKKLIGCLVLTGGLGNTAFVGLPVIEALYGKKGLETAIIVDQPGYFVVVSTLGILVAALYSKGMPTTATVLKKVLLFPPFLGFFAGFCMNLAHYDFIDTAQHVLQRLAATVTPIALVAVGLQLKIERKSKHWNFLALGLFFKLILTPLFFLVLYKVIFKGPKLETDISVMQAAMATQITAAILASVNGLKPRLSGMMVGIGIPLSFITMALWYIVLKFF
ncbi:AEC family transporter [Flavobacterium sp. Sd200]|uniref:AEC family transporter n=1 Tax=Flavobacterium sp. Sd200 TaxID=2692211 RepID=UPI00136C02B7|nr:AEC family transporter [Flavobacterium sp. Sd200]MXN90097.1 AEC family transporter [Flavobacterium sp. Sd200]